MTECLIALSLMTGTQVMKIKAIIVDLDRTLLRTDKSLSSYTVGVLKECKKHSIKIMVATARPVRTVTDYHIAIGFDAMAVSNGARIIYNGITAEYGICKDSTIKLLKALQRFPDLRITLETGDVAYSNVPIEDYETVVCEDLICVAEAEGVIKLLVGIDTEDTLELVKSQLSEDLYYTVANGRLIQIMDKEATKWNGIKTMLEIADISPDMVAYFGDDHDDIEPIKMCGMGIAVSNGIDEVKSVADYITGSNDEDGVAKFIKEAILRRAISREYLGKDVEVYVDRPLGSAHPKYSDMIYPVNYGYIPNTVGGDGEEIDVYLLGVSEPVKACCAKIIGVIHRLNDSEDKLVASLDGKKFTEEEIRNAVMFQEKYYNIEIETI